MKQIIYISNPESKNIYVWEINKKGLLKLLQIINTPGNGQPIAISPNKKYLYLGIRPLSSVVSYKIDNKGLLIQIGISSLPGFPTYITTDLTGNILYSVSFNNNCLSASNINNKGIVEKTKKILTGLIGCHSVNTSIDNKIIWIPCLKENIIYLYKIDKNNFFKKYQKIIFNSELTMGPRHMVFNRNGNYAYVINELSGTISIISIFYKKNFFSLKETISIMPNNFKGKCWSSDIHITPNNKFIYCCDRNTNMITIFKLLNKGSKLKLIGYKETEKQPRGFNIDTKGNFLIVAGQKSNFISVYKIDNNYGLLTYIKRYKVGLGPMWISIIDK